MHTTTSIGIIGYGIVGSALAHGFSGKKRYTIRYYDKFQNTESLKSVVEKSEFIFICLPTPMLADESGIDLSIITETVAKITPLTNGTNKIVTIKSTVVPGTTAAFQKQYPETTFAFNPEFLTEANYLEDFLSADRTIVGTLSNEASRRLVSLYRERFPETKIIQTDPTSAEMVKYMANAYLAVKVIFANQMFELSNNLGVSYPEIKKMVVADKRIYDSHLDVTTERGFGGKCFPKDLVALLGLGRELGLTLPLLETTWTINKQIRKIRDWEEIPFAVSSHNVQQSQPSH